MSIGESLIKLATGRDVRDTPADLGSIVRDLVADRNARGESRRHQAVRLGVGESTMRGWEKGLRSARGRANAYRRASGIWRETIIVGSPGAARIERHDFSLTLVGVPTRGHSGRTENRTVTAAKLNLADRTGERITEALRAGDRKRAVRILVASTRDPFYHQLLRDWADDPDIGDDFVESDYTVVGDDDYAVSVEVS
jgi:hypothetical protein